MGGNALKNTCECKPLIEHNEIVTKVLSFLQPLVTDAQEIKYIKSKDSFGDADILGIACVLYVAGKMEK